MMKGVYSKNPSYSAVHKWLARNHKKKERCEFCGSQKFLEWALKKRKRHEHVLESYLTLCSSCHKKYDYTDARREKLSQSLKGREITWRDKISEANKGRKLSEAQKKQISEYNKKHPRERNKAGRFTSKGVVVLESIRSF